MARQKSLNPTLKALLERGDRAGNFPISGETEQEFEQSFLNAVALSKQYAQSVGKPNADQTHLQCGTQQAVLSN